MPVCPTPRSRHVADARTIAQNADAVEYRASSSRFRRRDRQTTCYNDVHKNGSAPLANVQARGDSLQRSVIVRNSATRSSSRDVDDETTASIPSKRLDWLTRG
jgi:hypothetical protein